MATVRVVSAGVLWSVLLSGTSDASAIQKMLKDQRRILPLIGQFSDDQSRQSLSQVNQPLRTVVNRLRIQERTPDSQRKRKRQGESVDATVPCPQSKLEDCLNTVGEWNAKVAVFTEDQMVNVQGVPDSKKRKYDGTCEVVKKLPTQIEGHWCPSGNHEWVLVSDPNGVLRAAVHLQTGSEVNLTQHQSVYFVDEVMAVTHSLSKDGIHSFDLIMVIPHNPTPKIMRSVRFDPFPNNDPSLKILFAATMTEDESKGSSEIKVTVRTFAKLLHSDKYRVRLTTFEMYSQTKIKDFFLKTRDGSYLELPEEQAKSDHHLMQKYLLPGSEMYFIDQSQPSQSWLISTNVETEEQTELVPLLGKPKGFWMSDDAQYAVVEIIGSSNPFALYNIRDGCMVGSPLPFTQRPKFYKWLSNEIFAMEETVYGEKSPHYFGVSVDKPIDRFRISVANANAFRTLRGAQSQSMAASPNSHIHVLEWKQPALMPVRKLPAQIPPALTPAQLSVALQQARLQQQAAQTRLAANHANTQPIPMPNNNNNNNNNRVGPVPMAVPVPVKQPNHQTVVPNVQAQQPVQQAPVAVPTQNDGHAQSADQQSEAENNYYEHLIDHWRLQDEQEIMMRDQQLALKLWAQMKEQQSTHSGNQSPNARQVFVV